MKIIKKTDTDAWSHKYTCDKCETEMEIEKGDLCHQHHSGYGRESDYDEFYCFCPICHDKIVVVSSKIPKAVQVLVKQKNSPSSGIDMRDVGSGPPWDR